ncbi:threonylcarbamoyl-AMP synthase [Patescibacteria group bacterium]|nr:threonylcarbamoyl-AMP synthase [Patescibacteria group bacterium]MBU1015485.1 threonylcarbamoyl-AMP synthase [Patescibacteria group bacterium]MBU1685408.1 threonylcarbamoyl-AMP synthase [Patescibacteria group bacterium]MBU1938369.1 threonylcarbamoyl-AMP synthase [Patescibacteria group bacterium]
MKCLENNAENIKEAIKVLKAGGVIAHPADTCYGLAADLMNESALKRLQQIKGRDAGKPMSIMLPAYLKPKISQYAVLNEFSEAVCEKLLPGPITIVLPKGPKIPDYFFPEMPTVGIRIPYDAKTNDLLMAFNGPLITTSANLSDQPVCCSCQDVISVFKNNEHYPDLLLDGEIHGACLPSTVITLENDRVRILRPGPMEKEQMEAILGLTAE